MEELQSVDRAFLQILRILPAQEKIYPDIIRSIRQFLSDRKQIPFPQDPSSRTEYTALSQRLADRLKTRADRDLDRANTVEDKENAIQQLISWADSLKQATTTRTGRDLMPKPGTEAKGTDKASKKGHQP